MNQFFSKKHIQGKKFKKVLIDNVLTSLQKNRIG